MPQCPLTTRTTFILKAAPLAVGAITTFLLCSTPPSAPSQEPAPKPAARSLWEYTAASFAARGPEQATKVLNDLAADGWEYVGPLGNDLVAFKRRLWIGEKQVEQKNLDAEIIDRLNHIDSRLRHLAGIAWVEAIDVNQDNRKSRIYARQDLSVPIGELDRSFGAVTELKDKSMLTLLGRLTLVVPLKEQPDIERARQIVLELQRYRLDILDKQSPSDDAIQQTLKHLSARLSALRNVRWKGP